MVGVVLAWESDEWISTWSDAETPSTSTMASPNPDDRKKSRENETQAFFTLKTYAVSTMNCSEMLLWAQFGH